MNALCAIIGYTFKQHLRHRVYLTVGLFGLVLLAGSLVAASLAAEERIRLLLDLGLAGIELLALVAIVFVTVSLVLDEIDARSITLILTRPVKRLDYILGRYLGTFFSIAFGMILMALLHVGILLAVGWPPQWTYVMAWTCSLGKVAVVGSLQLSPALSPGLSQPFPPGTPVLVSFPLSAVGQGFHRAIWLSLGARRRSGHVELLFTAILD